APDGVKVNTTVLAACLDHPASHASLANHRTHPEITDDLPLVRLLAHRRRRPRRCDRPRACGILDHDRAAMVEDAALEGYAFGKLPAFVKIFVDRVSPGEHHAIDRDCVAHL